MIMKLQLSPNMIYYIDFDHENPLTKLGVAVTKVYYINIHLRIAIQGMDHLPL